MNSKLSNRERKVLDIMQKDNFRGLSKGNVMQLYSVLDKVDPEVAKVMIAQIPEVIKGSVENVKAYIGLLTRGIESCDTSTESCFQTEDNIINVCQQEISREDIPFEQKQFYFEKMEAAADRKEKKDTEHKNMVLTILEYGGKAFLVGCAVASTVYIGKANIKLPTMKAG